MLAFNRTNQRFGFSTGALELGDYRSALSWSVAHNVRNVELSALRYNELEPLVRDLTNLPLDQFDYISFHAPSAFTCQEEEQVVELLKDVHYRFRNWNIIVHPDVIYTPSLWSWLGEHLLIENMDRRKPSGRTADELGELFKKLPNARLCLDVAHARELDPTLTLLDQIVVRFTDRIAEVHISELDSNCRHNPLSMQAVSAYRTFADRIASCKHVIIESMLENRDSNQRMEELKSAERALSV